MILPLYSPDWSTVNHISSTNHSNGKVHWASPPWWSHWEDTVPSSPTSSCNKHLLPAVTTSLATQSSSFWSQFSYVVLTDADETLCHLFITANANTLPTLSCCSHGCWQDVVPPLCYHQHQYLPYPPLPTLFPSTTANAICGWNEEQYTTSNSNGAIKGGYDKCWGGC